MTVTDEMVEAAARKMWEMESSANFFDEVTQEAQEEARNFARQEIEAALALQPEDPRIADREKRLAALEQALTPTGDTKVAYSGEFSMGVTLRAPDGEEDYRRVDVPWDTIKDIMKAIKERSEAMADVTKEPPVKHDDMLGTLETGYRAAKAEDAARIAELQVERDELAGQVAALHEALHAAIATPMGVVPVQAEKFYDQRHPLLNGDRSSEKVCAHDQRIHDEAITSLADDIEAMDDGKPANVPALVRFIRDRVLKKGGA